MPTDFLTRLRDLNNRQAYLQGSMDSVAALRIAHPDHRLLQTILDLKQAELDELQEQLDREFHKLAVIANQN